MKAIKFFIALLALLQITMCYAAIDNRGTRTLVITVLNHSKNTLFYTGMTGTNPGTVFNVNPIEILPGGAATVTGMTSGYYDLNAILHFKDKANWDNHLTIVDYRQIKNKRSSFVMNNDKYISYVRENTLNKASHPNALTYSAVTVEIESKL